MEHSIVGGGVFVVPQNLKQKNAVLDFANPVAPQIHTLVILILAEWGVGP